MGLNAAKLFKVSKKWFEDSPIGFYIYDYQISVTNISKPD
jgi:hypothetical protein